MCARHHRRSLTPTGTLTLLMASVLGACMSAETDRDAVDRPTALVGGVLIDGTGSAPIENAVVVVDSGRIACAGPRDACDVPGEAFVVDVSGRWILPGLVDAHVHFSQTGWVDGRPDAVDLRDRYPYESVQARLKADPERYFRAYLCSGVTAVFDVGGYPWTWSLAARGASDPLAPRIAVAGPLLSTIDFWLNLPAERQFVFMADENVVREAVRYHAANGTDAIKIWYIMPPQPPDTARIASLVRAAAAEARSADLPLIVHATGLWEAKDAIRAGARLLVHSVYDQPVDDEFLSLARESGVIYTPTLTVWEGYGDVYRRRPVDSRYPLDCVDPQTREFGRAGAVPADRLPSFVADSAVAARQRARLEYALANARTVFEAGVPVAMGTDAGNPGTFHGPSVYREMELLRQAGLAPMDVLVSSTLVSARALGLDGEIGSLVAGKRADLIVIAEDPLADVHNLAAVEWVMKDGVLHRRDDLLPPASDGS